jgi:uncharacterized integral membrane protein
MTREQAAEYLFTIAGGTAVGAVFILFLLDALAVQDKSVRKFLFWGIGAALTAAGVLAIMGGILIMVAAR